MRASRRKVSWGGGVGGGQGFTDVVLCGVPDNALVGLILEIDHMIWSAIYDDSYRGVGQQRIRVAVCFRRRADKLE
jgi:hypothetical protein